MNCEPRLTPRILPLDGVNRLVPFFAVIFLLVSGSQAAARLDSALSATNLDRIPMMDVGEKGGE